MNRRDAKIIGDETTDGSRIYVDSKGLRYPSVTTILDVVDKPGLRDWVARQAATAGVEAGVGLCDMKKITGVAKKAAAREAAMAHEAVGQDAMDIGTRVHELLYHEGEVPPNDTRVYTAVEGWREFLKDLGRYEIIAKESADDPYATAVVGETPIGPYAGSFDTLLSTPKGRVLVEVKTSRQTYPIYASQAAAYAHALGLEKTDRVWVVRVDKYQIRYEISPVNVSRALQMFMAAQTIYDMTMREETNLWMDSYVSLEQLSENFNLPTS